MTRYPAECLAFEYKDKVYEGRLYQEDFASFNNSVLVLVENLGDRHRLGMYFISSSCDQLIQFKPLTRAARDLYEHVRLSLLERHG